MKNKIDTIFDALKYNYISQEQARKQVLDLFGVSGRENRCIDCKEPISNDKILCHKCSIPKF